MSRAGGHPMTNQEPGHPFEPFPGTDARCFIQWKGTDVCMDVYCRCGEHFHIDDDFAYYVECPECHQVYECGTQVKLVAIDREDARMEPKTELWRD